MRSTIALLAAFAVLACSAKAQQAIQQDFDLGSFGIRHQRIAVVDLELLFLRSNFGTRVLEERSDAVAKYHANNEIITRKLIELENEIAAKKPGLSDEEFESLRSEFDAMTECIRSDREEKFRLWKEWFQLQQDEFVQFAATNMQWILPGVDVVLPKSSAITFRSELDLTGTAVVFLNDILVANPELIEIDSIVSYVGITDQEEVFANYLEHCGNSAGADGSAAAGGTR